ncbi:MAG: pullulanase-type alpha-1,6-glucosidase [Deltaproteobacteria bacterium]|nr:pullulanase-type alpha-1,6-glucosidase [Deltaproteobacteria bacterium]
MFDSRSSLVVLVPLFIAACGESGSKPDDTGEATDTAVASETATDAEPEATPGPTFVVRYHRPDGAYDGWTLTASAGSDASTLAAAEVDDFGARFEVPLTAGATTLSYTFGKAGAAPDPDEPTSVTVADAPDGVWHFSGGAAPMLRAPPKVPGPDQLVVHYLRKDGVYAGWGLHTWLDVTSPTAWASPLAQGGVDPELGAWWLVDLAAGASEVGVIVHRGDDKDPGADMIVPLGSLGDMVFLVSGSTEISAWPVGIPELSIAGARAHWLDDDTLAWSPAAGTASVELRHAADASITVEGGDVVGGEALALTSDPAGLASDLRAAFPHLAGRAAWTIAAADLDAVDEALRGELVAVARDAQGAVVDATRVQIPGVLDARYAYDGPLGVSRDGADLRFAVWAPTAQMVNLLHHDAAGALVDTVAMTRGDDGVWRASGSATWLGGHYRYEVTVFHPVSGRVETVEVTDPYAVSLSANGALTHLVDLDDPALAPAGWAALAKPGIAAPEDIVIYEAHVRDFSASDATVPAADRGRYLAFTHNGRGGAARSNGMAHLEALADAGLTHLHLLPTFDIATVDELPERRVDITDGFDRLCAKNAAVPAAVCAEHGATPIAQVLAGLDPTSGDAQAMAAWLRGLDSFNWGYDPVHYNAVEGSYASVAGGAARVLEYRRMVKSLWDIGLRVVVDVVYNHTSQSGLGDKSVLDRIVPGYYHRLDADTGLVATSTCCANTATEHVMMRRLMVDSVVHWARTYKVDGFRFDLMGHHMKADMLAVRAALDALTLEADGVDGPAIYVYGEGWDFGEVAGGARGVNATQRNMAGTGIGTFNDRLRDAVRGGSAFDGGQALRRNQGFVNGLYLDPNELATADAASREALLQASERIAVGMAGNLRSWKLVDRTGATRTGAAISYNGAPTGYTQDPQEVINYVDKHDNQTLFDINAYRAKTGTTMADRVRMQNLGMDTILLGQGIPFLHMGMELLRSKSMERDSYDSGDWWNRVDFAAQTNHWNVGLPREDKDGANWGVIRGVLADGAIAPGPAHLAASAAHLRELLAIRQSSPLFRLRTADEVELRVHQRNVGPSQNPGVLFFTLSDATCAGDDLDVQRDGLVVFVNARPEAADFVLEGAAGWALHPVLAASADAVVRGASFAGGTFTVPARTSAVFVLPQGGAQGDAPGCNPL